MARMNELALAFLGKGRALPDDLAGLAARLDRIYQQAHTAWPGIELTAEEFARYLGEKVADESSQLQTLRIADLYLACACLRGDQRAQKIVDESFLSQIPRFIARIDPGLGDEIVQDMREKLFWPQSDAAAPLTRYAGRGDLLSWIRVLAIRAALRRRRSAGAPAEADEMVAIDPELEYLKERSRADVESSLKAALAALDDRQRLLLLLRYSDGVSVDRIATMYGAHRTTISRRIASARRTLLEETRRSLSERLKLNGKELDSLIALVRSRLEISLESTNASPPP
jgi:RNA polymerase sigma-70 factor (ECF subfamily)